MTDEAIDAAMLESLRRKQRELIRRAAARFGRQFTEEQIDDTDAGIGEAIEAIRQELNGRRAGSLKAIEIEGIFQAIEICCRLHFAIAYTVLEWIEQAVDDYYERHGSTLQ